ncbi:MAG: O-methyltransferase, partial [Spirochaetota bacterium]
DRYCYSNTTPEPQLLQELAVETRRDFVDAEMLTGRVEGRFLKMLAGLCGARTALDVGMYTGYSALSVAEALPEGGTVHTCEINEDVRAVARRYFDKSPHGKKIVIHMGPALETIQSLDVILDFVFLDADKHDLPEYYERVIEKLRPGGMVIIDNALRGGAVLGPRDDSDRAIIRVNKIVTEDLRVENVLLPVRDGMQIARKI